MSIKLKALLQLSGLVIASIVLAYVMEMIRQNFSPDTILAAFEYGLIGGLLYMAYSFLVSRLEYNEKMKEINDRTNAKT